MKRLLDMGVQGILTDYPDRLLRQLGRPQESSLSGGVSAELNSKTVTPK